MFSFSPSIAGIVHQRRPRSADSTDCAGCWAAWELCEISIVFPPVIITDYLLDYLTDRSGRDTFSAVSSTQASSLQVIWARR
jgi:hypothetical protein